MSNVAIYLMLFVCGVVVGYGMGLGILKLDKHERSKQSKN